MVRCQGNAAELNLSSPDHRTWRHGNNGSQVGDLTCSECNQYLAPEVHGYVRTPCVFLGVYPQMGRPDKGISEMTEPFGSAEFGAVGLTSDRG